MNYINLSLEEKIGQMIIFGINEENVIDDLKMKAINFMYGSNIAIKKAFEAGNDIIMAGLKEREIVEAIKNIKKLVEKNIIKEARIDRSIKRIIIAKQNHNINDNKIEKINKESINTLNNKI